MDELDIVNAFVVPAKRERYVGFVSSPKARRKFIEALYHFRDFDPAVIVELPPSLETRDGVLKELQRRGAGHTCYIVSADAELDRTTSPLSDAVDRVFTLVEGTIISCVAGRLAYYEGEAPRNRFILHRKSRSAV